MHKKDSSIPRVVNMIKINISVDPKYSVNGSNNVYTGFHRISPWHLPFSHIICNIDAALNFDIFIPPANCICGRVYCFHVVRPCILLSFRKGSAVAWWLIPQTPDPEVGVGVSSPTRVKPCCVLEQGTFTPQKHW